MLETLLESRSKTAANNFGAAASATVHVVVIVLAAYATAAGATAERGPDATEKIDWVPAVIRRAPPRPSAAVESHAVTERRLPSPSPVSIDIPANLPRVDIPLATIGSRDFDPAGETHSVPPTSGDSGPGIGEADRPYDASEVEFPASAIAGTIRPEYPSALRSSGIEGQVIAQFVVDEKGRAHSQTLRIVSSTNDMFAESVTRSLSRMRFVPARVGGRPVAQLVQQLFVFRLDR
ncbi:MAG: energy transducer TonB [Gemmatimonadales bacterium]